MTDQSVGGVSVPLTIDRSGWTAGLKAARQELEQFKSAAQSAGVGATGRSIRGGAVAAPPLAAIPQSQLPAVSNVSPRFAVSQGAIREMRVQMNQQIRQLASQGEAVQIPIKLGRVPYASMRNEIATGIGEVPVKIVLDPSSVAIIRGQITGAIGRTGSGGRVSEGQLPLTKRATGGPVSPHQDVIVGDGGRAEVFRPTQAGRILPQVTMADQMRQRQLAIIRQQIQQDRGSYPKAMAGMQVHGRYSRSQSMRGLSPQQGNFDANVMSAAGRLQPHHIQGGINWYREMAAYGQERSRHYGVAPSTGIGVLAALSAGTEWQANKTKFERIMAAHAAGKPFPYETKATGQMSLGLSTAERKKMQEGLDAHRKAQAILRGQPPEKAFATSEKVGQFYRAGMGDLSSLVIDTWATRTATKGGMAQPGRARPGIESAFRKGAQSVGLQNAEFQAALWLMEKEESLVPPGQMGMGFQRGGRIRQAPGQTGMGFAPKFPKSRPYCSICGTTMANPFDHNTSAQHKKNLQKRTQFQGTKLTQRPSWMTSLGNYENQYDEEELEYETRKLGLYPGGKWAPGMLRGGRTGRKSQWGKIAPADVDWLYDMGRYGKRKYNKPSWDEALDPEYMTRFRGDPHDKGPGSGHVYTEPMDPMMYHVTSGRNMESILKEGVQPRRSGRHRYGSLNRDKPGTYWSEYPDAGWGGDEGVALATRLSNIQDPDSDPIGSLYSKQGVPRSKLMFLGANKRLNKLAGGGRARMRGAGYVPGLRSIAQGYNRQAGLPPMQEQMLHPLNADFSRRTAAAYEAMPGGTDPLSRRAYGAFAEETEAQYEYLQKAGFKFEADPGDPYTPKPGGKLTKMQLAARDVSRNKRLLAFSSALEHPLLTNEQNLQFRHVHDMMGHLTEGYSIGPRGEFNAAVKHSQMFSPLARRAMLAETHGQNSVVNFSPTVLPGYGGRSIADVNKAAPGTIYADQKARGLPENILEEFYRLTGIKRKDGGGVLKLSTVGKGGRWAGDVRNIRGAANVRPADLKPYMLTDPFSYENPRYMQSLMNSIRESGFFEPATVTIRGNGPGAYVTDGNHRVAIADLMGLESIPTRFRGPGGRFASPSALGIDTIKKAGGGFIRSLFGRAGPSKDQLRAGYGSRLTGFSEKFPSPTPGPAGLAIQALGHTLSAEQRQPNIDLNEAIKRLPDVRRESGATSRYLHQQAELVQLRQAQHMEPLTGSKYEPFQNAPMLPGQGGGKTLEIKPHWLPRMGIDPTKISKNAVGGQVWDALEGPHAGAISGEAARLGEMYPGAEATRLRTSKGLRSRGAYGGGVDPEIFFKEDLGGVDPAYVARHEFGHHLDATIGKKGLVARARLWNLKRQIGKNPATRYAATDRNEAFAELFARRDDPDLSPKHQGLLGKVDKLTERYVGGPQHLMAGGPVTKTFRLADPNGLHMRPAAAFARAMSRTQASVTGRNLSNGQDLINPESINSWMALGARQGHKIELTASGADSAQAMKLFGQLMGFNPEKSGMGYHEFQKKLGVSSPGVEALEFRRGQREATDKDIDRALRGRASGGPAKGKYIVNEIGREKFVPDRLAHTIPPEVAEQLPESGGLMARLAQARGEAKPEPWKPAWMRRPSAKDLTGRAKGGVVEIPGHGARLWEAPEDGWIIPARLAGKIPQRHAGGPAGHGHDPSGQHIRGRDGRLMTQAELDRGTGANRGAFSQIFQRQQVGPSSAFAPDPTAGRTPPTSTWRGALFGAPQQGPPAPGGTWRGAMLGTGGSNALRDSFKGALESVFGRSATNLITPLEDMAAPLEEMVAPQPTPRVGGQGYASFAEAHVAVQAQRVQQGENPNDPDMLSTQRKKTFGIVRQAGATRRSFFESLPTGGGVDEEGLPAQNPLRILEQEARISAAAVRGLTPRSAAGGIGGALLGGGQARREAMVRGQGLTRAYERMLPEGFAPGTDTLRAFGEQLRDLEDQGKTVTSRIKELGGTVEGTGTSLTATFNKLDKSMVATDDEIGKLTDELNANQRAQGVARESIKTAGATRLEAEKQFDKARGGAAANILSITAAGFAFSALSGAISTGLTLATKAAEPFIDEITGFQSISTRVTQGLAQQARQLGGNVPAAVAGAAGPAGVGGAGLDFLTRTLAPSISAKAGAAAAAEASDLFRAAAGSGRAPTGLFSGFGGVGGSPFLAELLGGGKGFTEVLGGDVAALRGQAQGLTGVNALRGPTNVGTGRDPIGDFLLGTGTGTGNRGLFGDIGAAVEGALGGPTAEEYGPGAQPTTPDQDAAARNLALETLTTEVKDYNAAAKRGADALGEHTTGLRLATREQLGLTEATDDLQQATMKQVGTAAGDESAGKLSDAGIFLVDAAGNLVQGTEQYRKFFEQSAQGRTIGTPEAFAAQQSRQLLAQRQVSRLSTERQINLEIPGQVGQQLAANPFTSAFSGIPGLASASKGLISNLEETQRLQKEITAEGQAAVEAQARDIDVQTGTRQGAQFRSYMADVTAIGSEIAGITEAISNRQAQVSFAAYSNNIRILNRSISDARGLLTGRGGAGNLGAIQRAQFDLSRQSQRLSLQSQSLQLQSNQLSLELSQRQINFQKAIAGFQAPGITGQERAARMAEAELEASFAQKQLNIGVQQQGIGQQQLGISGQQFGLELKAFMVSAQRSVVDLEAQRGITQAQFALEQEQIAAQKRISALTIRMGERQAKAQALVQEAQGNFGSVLSAAGQQIAQFGGVAAAAAKVIMAALRPGGSYASAYQRAAGTYGGKNTYSNTTPHAAGYSGMASGPTSFVAGEAGPEHVLVLRNPKSGVMGPAGGGGGGNTIQINVSGNTFGADLSAGDVARQLADEVERRFETKARLLSVSA